MKKPNIEDYKLNDSEYSQKYITDLEKYCNGLEHEFKVLKEEYNADQKYIEDFDKTKDWYWNKIKRLEKALYTACYMLERFDKICHSIYPMTKEQWKERLMEDE